MRTFCTHASIENSGRLTPHCVEFIFFLIFFFENWFESILEIKSLQREDFLHLALCWEQFWLVGSQKLDLDLRQTLDVVDQWFHHCKRLQTCGKIEPTFVFWRHFTAYQRHRQIRTFPCRFVYIATTTEGRKYSKYRLKWECFPPKVSKTEPCCYDVRNAVVTSPKLRKRSWSLREIRKQFLISCTNGH